MPSILIGGYYGAGNIGDEAILAAMLQELRAQRSDLTFTVTSWDPEKTSRELQVKAIFYNDIRGLLDAGSQADLVILGGGGIFHDYWGLDPDSYLRRGYWDISFFGSLPLLARLLDIPCMIYAVGVGPLNSDLAREHTRLAFERCQVATLRDPESLAELRQTGLALEGAESPRVEILPDPVYSFPLSEEQQAGAVDFLRQRGIPDSAQLLGISLRYWDLEGPLEAWLECIAAGVRDFLDRTPHAQALLIPFQVTQSTPHTNDALVLQRLAGLVDRPGRVHWIETPLSPGLAQGLIKRCRVLLGMRLHSVIMALNAGTPVVALAYAPKVSSAMKQSGQEAFCFTSLLTPAGELSARLLTAWGRKEAFQREIEPVRQELNSSSKKHAALAMDLLARAHRKPLGFTQQFALEKVRQLLKMDEGLSGLQMEKDALQARYEQQLQEMQSRHQAELNILVEQLSVLQERSDRLNTIETSRIWRWANRYYRLREGTFLRYPYRFLSTWRQAGPGPALHKSWTFLSRPRGSAGSGAAELSRLPAGLSSSAEIVGHVVRQLNGRAIRGVHVITSQASFNERFDQRASDLARTLAAKGWGILFVCPVRTNAEPPASAGDEVHPNIFQVPQDMLLEQAGQLAGLTPPGKYFLIEFPHPDFLSCLLTLRQAGFLGVYEIVEEWEKLQNEGRASWYRRSSEQALVLNANFLTAASQPLVDKFAGLRRDIHLLPDRSGPSGWEDRCADFQKILEQDPWMSF
jgi:polysaccharide pyruvyl transferase CsaB